jgi:hypothetical protein
MLSALFHWGTSGISRLIANNIVGRVSITFNQEKAMFRVWYYDRWLENIPAVEALVFKEEGHVVVRMDLPFQTPPK